MAKSRKQKEEVVARLTDAFKTSPSATFVHFTGLSVGDETEMRGVLSADSLKYFVAKKPLIKIALKEAGIKGDVPTLDGEIAIAYGSDDPTAPARGIHEFVTKYKDNLSIVGGVYEGEFKDAAGMNEIATIPPLDVLRGMFANVINSPIQRIAIALGQVAEQKTA